MSLRLSLLLCWLLAATVLRAVPTNRYVSLAGGNVSPYDSWERAGTSLKTVVDYANTFNAGDTVWVSNGVHTLGATVTINKNTIVKSFNTNRAETIVNGAGAYRCFTLNHSNAWLEGLTVSNGYSTSSGGGVYLMNGTVTNCEIRNCRVVGNYGGGGGLCVLVGLVADCSIVSNLSDQAPIGGSTAGGVFLQTGPSTLRGCYIAYNTSDAGGGVGGHYQGSPSVVDDCEIAYNKATNTHGGGFLGSVGQSFTNCRIYGNTAAGCGGGVMDPSSLQDCIISNNTAAGQGGGVYTFYRPASIVNCTIVGNVASSIGGGLYLTRYQNTVSNCTIRGNTALKGGGAYLYYPYDASGRFDFYNCLISGNVAISNAGGIAINFFASRNPITIKNCTIVSNYASGVSSVGGIMCGRSSASTAMFINVIAYLNAGAGASNWTSGEPGLSGAILCFSNSCTAPINGTGFIGTDNIDVDPQFVGPASRDYHLQKGSPCINTGLTQDWMAGAVDLDGRPRIREGTVDMGAYEYFPQGAIVTFR